jgi:N6-adenosine-specific RNA methylase IME4
VGRYHLIYADPPWWYAPRRGDRLGGGAWGHYALMPDTDLVAMRQQVDEWAAPECVLAMWATGPRLDFACRLVDAWGFRFVTVLLVWSKVDARGHPVDGWGRYHRPCCEYLLMGARGSVPTPYYRPTQLLVTRRGEHSEKPEEARAILERMWGEWGMPRLELFARRASPGWDVWGDEAPTGAQADDTQGRLFE